VIAGDGGCGETAAVDGDRVAEGEFIAELGGNVKTRTVASALDGLDGPNVFDQAREHVTTP
jgi:hypothetical protein